jgi:hypothetical protein
MLSESAHTYVEQRIAYEIVTLSFKSACVVLRWVLKLQGDNFWHKTGSLNVNNPCQLEASPYICRVASMYLIGEYLGVLEFNTCFNPSIGDAMTDNHPTPDFYTIFWEQVVQCLWKGLVVF